MTNFVLEEAREYVDIGYADVFDPTTQTARREYQARDKSGRIVASAFDLIEFERQLAAALSRMRITLPPAAVGRSIRGWGIQEVQTVDGNGTILDTYFQVVDPQGVVRSGNFSTIEEAEYARRQLMTPSNFNDQNPGRGGGGPAPSM
ncbi:MAG TPA: hypothetical protein VGR71_10860 [Nitrospira sp.]|nr:hypothetical protein [Nitrospira sp.]